MLTQPQHTPFDWPHAPVHRLDQAGMYIVTAGTYQKQMFFKGDDRLSYLTNALLHQAQNHGLRLQAWAVFPNHYHLIVQTERATALVAFTRYVHAVTAKHVNRLDATPGRKVWHQYWDTKITFQRSFLVRLHYVHTNAVRHGIVASPELYPWCSAGWFAKTASRSFFKTVMNLPSDQVAVQDDYELA
jgi:putative transposase